MRRIAPLATLLQRSTWRGALLGLTCAAICWGLTWLGFVRGMEEWVLDSYFFLRGPRPSEAKVVIVGLDERSLNELNKPLIFASPELATVVRHAHAQRAAAVGIDIILPENAINIPDIVEPDGVGFAGDMGLAVAEAGNVVLAEWYLPSGWREPFPQWSLLRAAMSEEEKFSTDIGFVNFTGDSDQFVRKQQLLISRRTPDGNEPRAEFALALAAKASGGYAWDPETGLILDGRPVPLGTEQKVRINYVGPPNTIPVIPMADILADAEKGRETPRLRDAIVIVGVTAEDWQDYHPTPYSNLYFGEQVGLRGGLMSGPEIQGHIAATLMDRAFIRESPWVEPVALLIAGLFMGMLAMRLSLRADLLCTVLFVAVWYLLGAWLFIGFHWHTPAVSLVMLAGLTALTGFLRRGLILRDILTAVKSAPIARALESSGHADLRGELREVSVLFADIRSFTPFSERFTKEPQKVVKLLNAYFTAIVPELDRFGGTLNQYMGDGIMVLFGAPDRQEDHAYRAVCAAKALARRVATHPEEWAKHGYPGMRIGVGICTGSALVGAIGSPRRLDYTAIGDTTNTASRIESKTKEVGTTILISEPTMDSLTEAQKVELRLEGIEPIEVELKGKSGTLRVYPVPFDETVAFTGQRAAMKRPKN